jgi:hypothetical protein
MSDEKKPEQPDWRRSPTGLYVPAGVPDGGKKPPVGFAAALEKKPERKDA